MVLITEAGQAQTVGLLKVDEGSADDGSAVGGLDGSFDFAGMAKEPFGVEDFAAGVLAGHDVVFGDFSVAVDVAA